MADYPISAVHALDIRKIKISEGNRFRTFMSFLIPARLRPAQRVMIPPVAEKSAMISGVIKDCTAPDTRNSVP